MDITRRLCAFFLLIAIILFPAAAQAQISIQGQEDFDFTVKPDSVYEGTFSVRNTSGRFQQVRLYQKDYRFNHDGETFFDEPGDTPRSNADWISFSPASLSLNPGEEMAVHFDLRVPEKDDAGEPVNGSYWSVMMVEAMPTEVNVASADDENKPKFSVIMRYGVEIAAHVVGTGKSALRFTGADLTQDVEAENQLQIGVENTGDLMMVPIAWVEIFDASGIAVARVEGAPHRLYPGTSVRYAYDLTDLPTGMYEALVVLDVGGEEVYGAQYSLEL